MLTHLTPEALADTVGIFGFALAGIMAAAGRRVDPVGVFVLAFTTAFGGGLIRDIIIDRRPFYWVEHDYFVWGILVLTIFAPRLVFRFSEKTANRIYLWADAVGLGFFSAAGTWAAYVDARFPSIAAVLIGVCTGVFGGLLRDVFLNRVPAVLSDRKPYAAAAFTGSWLAVLFAKVGTDPTTALWTTAAAIIFIRMGALKLGLEIRYLTPRAKVVFPGNGPLESSGTQAPPSVHPKDAKDADGKN